MFFRTFSMLALTTSLVLAAGSVQAQDQGGGGFGGGQGGGRGGQQGGGRGGQQPGGRGGQQPGGRGQAAVPSGPRPKDTDYTKKAQVFVLQKQYQQALDQLQQGLQKTPADSSNARYALLEGQAQAGLGHYDEANAAFERALRLFPGYSTDVAASRQEAWAQIFNEGVTAYNAGNTDAAVAAWEKADMIDKSRPEAFQNLGAIYTQKGDYDKAIAAYQGGLDAITNAPANVQLTAEQQKERADAKQTMFENLGELLAYTEKYADAEKLYRQALQADSTNVSLQSKLAGAIAAQPGRQAEATAMYNRLLAMPNLGAQDYQDIGAALFAAKDYTRAAEAFGHEVQLWPNSRDALYNQANALYAGEKWTDLLPVAQNLVKLDPLVEDSWLILARAQREAKQNNEALATLQTVEKMPVKLKSLQLRPGQGNSSVVGQVIGNAAAAGTPVQLRFTFYDAKGNALGTQTATVNAPAKDGTARFTVTFQNPTAATAYTYQVVQ